MTEKPNPTRARFAWLDAVATDARLPPLAVRVAVVLGRWLNAEGVAWPAVATIAAALGATDRAVQKAIAALVDAGHLTIERNGGRGRTNVMTIVVTTDESPDKGERVDTLSAQKRVNGAAEKGEQTGRKGCPPVHPNQYLTNRSPPGISIEPDRREARAPSGAALVDLTRPEPNHREIEDALAAGELTPAQADFLRRNRSSAYV